jgi:hypothetical protein
MWNNGDFIGEKIDNKQIVSSNSQNKSVGPNNRIKSNIPVDKETGYPIGWEKMSLKELSDWVDNTEEGLIWAKKMMTGVVNTMYEQAIDKAMSSSSSYGSSTDGQSKIIQGEYKSGKVIARVSEDKLIQGEYISGKVIARIVDDKIVQGEYKSGRVIARVVEDKVIAGEYTSGKVIARIVDDKIVQGEYTSGKVIGRVVDGGRMSAAAGAVYLLLL